MTKRTYKLVIVFSLLGTLNGCETMMAHYRMSPQNIVSIASGNAAANICLSNNHINKSTAYNYNVAGAQLLDISVFDWDIYDRQYQNVLNEFRAMTPAQTEKSCRMAEDAMPNLTARMLKDYNNIASSLSKSRSLEMKEMSNSLAGIGEALSENGGYTNLRGATINPSSSVDFTPEKLPAEHYLINTNNGITQCMATSKGYVFCM